MNNTNNDSAFVRCSDERGHASVFGRRRVHERQARDFMKGTCSSIASSQHGTESQLYSMGDWNVQSRTETWQCSPLVSA